LTAKIFAKLFGLFILPLLICIVVIEFVFNSLMERAPHGTQYLLGYEALWSGLITLALVLPVAVWAARRIAAHLESIAEFARRIAEGDFSARLSHAEDDEFSTVEIMLNQTAERLGKNFAKIEGRRQELATMLDSMQEAVITVNSGGLVCWSNAVMQNIANTEIRVGRPLVHAVRDPELLACVKATLDEGKVHYGRASTLAPGRVFEINAVPMPSGGALAVLHDVTSIEAAETVRRDFIANVSHELRTPLTSIQGYVETLIEDPDTSPEITREFLGIILKNATRMNRITEDLLTLASVESPGYKLALQPKSARALLEDAIASLGGMVADSGMALEFAGAPDAQVLADADTLNQVFGNLIENALRYGKTGRRIIVGARQLESEVEFTVQDFGPGIASEHIVRIFERFYRVDKARSRESGGTGLGLAIVKHIVLAHHGRIWVESELGSGATFHFTLPLASEVS
jgi:two-component system, OmpR family, phosphate regulon sensor histidine kinase PhoR